MDTWNPKGWGEIANGQGGRRMSVARSPNQPRRNQEVVSDPLVDKLQSPQTHGQIERIHELESEMHDIDRSQHSGELEDKKHAKVIPSRTMSQSSNGVEQTRKRWQPKGW